MQPQSTQNTPPSLEKIKQIINTLELEGDYKLPQIGLILRDKYQLPNIKEAYGLKLSSLCRQDKLPQDLFFLLKRYVVSSKHLIKNKKDKFGKRRLDLLVNHIFRVYHYYSKKNRLNMIALRFKVQNFNLILNRYGN